MFIVFFVSFWLKKYLTEMWGISRQSESGHVPKAPNEGETLQKNYPSVTLTRTSRTQACRLRLGEPLGGSWGNPRGRRAVRGFEARGTLKREPGGTQMGQAQYSALNHSVRTGTGGTRPGNHKYQRFKTLYKNPLGKPS